MSCYERVNEFRINLTARKELGYGAQGTVYPGISLITKDPVAAKRRKGIWKEYFDKDEFEKEADLLLNRIPPHENIIKVLDFTKIEYEDKGIPKVDLWLITELGEFGNLKEFAYSRDLSIEQKIELMYQSALAVHHLHGCKPESVAHRDVKPENILLTGNEDNPTVKLCDFGSAKSVTHKDGKSVAMWSLAGTRRYQAPEQVECHDGHSKYDKQVDIFSLGITFLALLKTVKGSLMSPETIDYKGLGEIMWIKNKRRQAFTFLIHKSSDSSMVRAVKNVIENMIKFEPSTRFSAIKVVEELSKLRKEHPAPQPTSATFPQLAPATDLQPSLATDPHRSPATDPQPSPTTDPQPSPATDPQPSSTTDPQPSPATDPQTSPTTDPQPSPATDPQTSPTTDPQPSPATHPQPSPATDLEPSPATDPQLSPATDCQPSTATDPQRSTATDPQPSPATDLQASPATDPQPSTATDCLPSPTTDPKPSPTIVPQQAPTTDPPATPSIDPPATPTADPPAAPTTDPPAAPTTDPPAAPTTDPPAPPTTDPSAPPTTYPPAAPATDPPAAPATDPQPSPTTDPQPSPATDPPTIPTTYPQAAPTTDPPATPPTDNIVASTIDIQPSLTKVTLQPGTKVIALHSFKAIEKEDLSFETNDALTIIDSTSNPNWSLAQDKNGKIGTIPLNHVLGRSEVNLQPVKWLFGGMTWIEAHALLVGKEIPEHMTKKEARQLLSQQDVGTFLVHVALDDDKMVIDHLYTLHVVRPDRKVEHYRIFTKDGKLTINDRFVFADLQELVQFYGKDAHGLCTILQNPLVKAVNAGDFLRNGWNINQSQIHMLDRRSCYTGELTDTYNGEYSGRDVFITKRKNPHSVHDAQIEAAVMTGLSHKNLVQLIGVVLGDETLIVTEFLSKGRLYDYLRSQGPDGISSQDQMSFARDVCLGMQYLEQTNIVHRNLKARSVLLSEEGIAKVGDFNRAYPVDRCMAVKQFPNRWSAPEAMRGETVTSKYDEWSFGVLLWEIYSFGREPYPVIPNKDILTLVEDGGRLEAPDECPDEIYHVMLAAWDIDPTKRPTFSDIWKILDKLEVGTLMMCQDSLEEDWNISQSEVHVLDNWYTSAFTDTYKGEYSGRDVFIRKRKDPHSVQDARFEAAVMTGLSHKNLVQLIGVVLGDETLIVTEFLSKGRLHNYLRSRGPDGITSQDQVSFARDVCHGMHYLEQKHIVHRSLWARSVLLSQDGTAKVGNFILAHPVDQLKTIKQFLYRWSAPEALRGEKLRSKSDVWSFGVLLWEIYSYGQKPYRRIHNKDILNHVQDGRRLEAPNECPDEIYHVMLAAWGMDPAKRPTFSDVCEILDSLKVPKKHHISGPFELVKTLFRR